MPFQAGEADQLARLYLDIEGFGALTQAECHESSIAELVVRVVQRPMGLSADAWLTVGAAHQADKIIRAPLALL